MIDHYDGYSGHHILSMSRECAEDCSVPGQSADEAVAYWVPRVQWHANEIELRRVCRETGAWDDSETADIEETIKPRVLWMAACDWRENEMQVNAEADLDRYGL